MTACKPSESWALARRGPPAAISETTAQTRPGNPGLLDQECDLSQGPCVRPGRSGRRLRRPRSDPGAAPAGEAGHSPRGAMLRRGSCLPETCDTAVAVWAAARVVGALSSPSLPRGPEASTFKCEPV